MILSMYMIRRGCMMSDEWWWWWRCCLPQAGDTHRKQSYINCEFMQGGRAGLNAGTVYTYKKKANTVWNDMDDLLELMPQVVYVTLATHKGAPLLPSLPRASSHSVRCCPTTGLLPQCEVQPNRHKLPCTTHRYNGGPPGTIRPGPRMWHLSRLCDYYGRSPIRHSWLWYCQLSTQHSCSGTQPQTAPRGRGCSRVAMLCLGGWNPSFVPGGDKTDKPRRLVVVLIVI